MASGFHCFFTKLLCAQPVYWIGDHSAFGVFLYGDGIIYLCVDFLYDGWSSYSLHWLICVAVHDSCTCFAYGLIFT